MEPSRYARRDDTGLGGEEKDDEQNCFGRQDDTGYRHDFAVGKPKTQRLIRSDDASARSLLVKS
jgi:hypothetical protein